MRQPILAALLERRVHGLVITAAAALQIGLAALGLPAWPCPAQKGLGFTTPGCGLTRAILALFRGDWTAAIEYHAFAPLFVLTLAAIGVVSLLPETKRRQAVDRIAALERRTGAVAIGLIGLMLYWLFRLLILRDSYFHLIAHGMP